MFRECYRTATVREPVPFPIFSRLLKGVGVFGLKHKPPHRQKGNAGVSLYRAVKRPVHRSSGFVTERNLNVQYDGDFNSRPPRAGY
jgi:hypothetical protein